MTAFFIACGVLSVLAMAFVALPLLRVRAQSTQADRRAINVALYRQRIAEIDEQRDSGQISDNEHESLSAESAAALLEDADDGPATATGVSQRVPIVLVGLIVVVVVGGASLIYSDLGAIGLVELDRDRALLSADGDDETSLGDWAQRLEAHLAHHPDDAKSWYLLGHARMRQGNYRAAVTAFEALDRQAAGEANVMTALAQARYLADDGVISDDTRALMNRVIAIAPQEPIVRELLAVDAFRAGRFAEAVVHLENALAGGVGGARADAMRAALERARAASGQAPPAGIDIDIGMDGVPTAQHPGAALFVFARRSGERMPLLVARVAPQSPLTRVRLDATNAMQPGAVPTPGEALDVVARFSPSGRVGEEAGAMETTVRIIWGETPAAAMSFASTASADKLPASAPPSNAVRLRVALAPGITAPAGSRVFVILREPAGPPIPVAVRPIEPSALPAEIEVTDRDAMQPGRVVSQFKSLEVLARLSASGTAMRQPGDLESAAVQVVPGDPGVVELVIGDS